MAKLYFFSNKGWGECYTVMADNEKEARYFVLKYLEEDARDLSIYDYDPALKGIMAAEEAKRADIDGNYDIRVYEHGQVIETEYA